MMVPTVHLNGTSKDDLLEQVASAGDAVGRAIDALVLAQPNARDYYPQGSDAFSMATREHLARLAALETVKRELYELLERIDG